MYSKVFLTKWICVVKNFTFLAILCLAITGCASTPKTIYQPTQQKISEPPINSTNTANIGDKLLVQGLMTERQAVYFATDQKFILGSVIRQGYFAKHSEDGEHEFYRQTNDSGAGKYLDVLNMEIPTGFAIKKSDNSVCAVNLMGGAVNCRAGINFEKKNWVTANSNSFQQTLIYNGKVGNKINIAYREFSSDMARPAFNNDVEYDLSESKQIGYKGALLEVIDANNQTITYKVIKNFNTN